MRERSPLGLALLLACGLTITRANFLFTEEPLARFSPAANDTDTDLFGYAVTLHRLDNTGDQDNFTHAIMNTKLVFPLLVYY